MATMTVCCWLSPWRVIVCYSSLKLPATSASWRPPYSCSRYCLGAAVGSQCATEISHGLPDTSATSFAMNCPLDRVRITSSLAVVWAAWCKTIAENLNPASSVHQRYSRRQQTPDGWEKRMFWGSKKANRILRMIKRNFTVRSQSTLIPLYTWNTVVQYWVDQDIELIEGVQRQATKFVKDVEHLHYNDRLEHLGLMCLYTRRIRSDLIDTL